MKNKLAKLTAVTLAASMVIHGNFHILPRIHYSAV